MQITVYKNILLLGIISVSQWANGQITITSSNMPSVNDTIRYSSVQNTIGFNFVSTGENKDWDFTKLKASAQSVNKYLNSTATPYVLNFGFTSIGIKLADSLGTGQAGLKNVYTFFKKSATKWEAVGIGFTLSALPLPQAGKHTNTDEIYTFPLNYKDRDSTPFALKVPISLVINLGNYFQEGNRVNTVDGWGKISTPYASNVECIRIKSVITQKDSLAIAITGQAPINFGFNNNRVEYKWLSKTEKIPMLEVTGTEVNGNFIPTNITFRDNYRDLTANPLAPVADFKSDKLNAKVNETITLTDLSSNSPTSHLWTITPNTFNFVNGTTNTSKNPQIVFTNKGMYTIRLTASNAIGPGTTTKTNYINISDNASLEISKATTIVTYPNPAQDFINIEVPNFANASIKLFVFNMEGQQIENLIYRFENANTLALNTEKFSSGKYTALMHYGTQIYYSNFNILK
jgi:hypothetical protein